MVEFFPPSLYENLKRSLRKTSWGGIHDFLEGPSAERIEQGRRRSGWHWSQIGSISDPAGGFSALNGTPERLPEEFAWVEVNALQLGTSLTAVVAFMAFSEEGGKCLDEVWRGRHEPTFKLNGLGIPEVENRLFAAILATQRERQRIHDVARDWFSKKLGGFFAEAEERQPVIDFNLFDGFDPAGKLDRSYSEPLRALGMQGDPFRNLVSTSIPGATLARGEELRRRRKGLSNCWGVLANRENYRDQNRSPGRDLNSDQSMAYVADRAVRELIVQISMLQYLDLLRGKISVARDTARVKHGKFKVRQIRELTQELLTLSIDLPVIARDRKEFWSSRFGEEVTLIGVPIPDEGLAVPEWNATEAWKRAGSRISKQLIKDDAAYRDVVSTVSDLGAAAASTKLGRRALLVSATSVLISLTALLLSNDQAGWDWLMNLVRSLTGW